MEELTSFRLVFGNSPIIKVLDFFLDNEEFDYSLTDVAKYADIGWSTLHQVWPKLVALGIVTKTRRIGRAEMHRLNTKNPLVKKLIELDMTLSKQAIESQLLEKVV